MNRLRELREDKDLYQKDIAKYLNMSPNFDSFDIKILTNIDKI